LDYTACQNKDLKHDIKILHQFNSNIRAHLMSLGENIEAFDSLKKLERIFIKKKTLKNLNPNKQILLKKIL
jgi:hypothetical protein